MKKLFYIMLLALPLCLNGCSDKEDDTLCNSPVLMAFDCRLDIYNADGTAHEIDREEIIYGWGEIEMQVKKCEEESFSNLPFDYYGNSLYFDLRIWSNEHSGHQDNVVFTVRIKSEMLFGDEEVRDITVCANIKDMNYCIINDIDFVKSVTSSDVQVHSDLSMVEDGQAEKPSDVLVLPIRLTLDGNAQK